MMNKHEEAGRKYFWSPDNRVLDVGHWTLDVRKEKEREKGTLAVDDS